MCILAFHSTWMEVGEPLTGVSSPYPVGPGVVLTVPLKPFYSCDARVSHELLHSITKVSSQRIRSLPGAYLSCVGIYKMLNEYPLISKGTHSQSRPITPRFSAHHKDYMDERWGEVLSSWTHCNDELLPKSSRWGSIQWSGLIWLRQLHETPHPLLSSLGSCTHLTHMHTK